MFRFERGLCPAQVVYRGRFGREPPSESVHLVTLAELEGLRAVVELGAADQPFLGEQALERGEPTLVVAQRLRPLAHARNLVDEAPPELLPGVVTLVVEGHGHPEHAALPGRLEDQLAVLAR